MDRVLVVPSQNDGVHCALGTFSAGETSCSPPHISALIHSWYSSFDLVVWFLDMLLWEPSTGRCESLQITFSQLNVPHLESFSLSLFNSAKGFDITKCGRSKKVCKLSICTGNTYV